jgi:hypothetical protein
MFDPVVAVNRVRKKPTDCQNHQVTMAQALHASPILLFSLHFVPWHEFCIYQVDLLNNGD